MNKIIEYDQDSLPTTKLDLGKAMGVYKLHKQQDPINKITKQKRLTKYPLKVFPSIPIGTGVA